MNHVRIERYSNRYGFFYNLSALKEPLRSHGGISEQRVPFMLNRPTTGLKEEGQLRNFDIFDAALNHVS